MTATNGLGTYGDGAGVVTPSAHRLAQLGLVTKNGAGTNAIRAGLFFDGVSNIVTGTANMSYNVAAFTAVSSRGASSGAVLFANDGTVNVVTTAAPGTNSRIDVVYVWQREFALDGGSTAPVIGVVQGTAAGSPVAPSLAAFPGAIELARITVPAGVTATNSGTTITQTAPFTATAGAPIVVRNVAALPATAIVGARARTLDNGVTYEWNGSAWIIPPLGLREVVRFTSSGSFSKATYPWLRAIRVRVVGGGGGGAGCGTTAAGQISAGGGGGGGSYTEDFITDIAGLASSVTVTVGTGGAGGAAGNNAGATGVQSSFGAGTTAPAGLGGGVRAAAAAPEYSGAGGAGGGSGVAVNGFAIAGGTGVNEVQLATRVTLAAGGGSFLSGGPGFGGNTGSGAGGSTGPVYGGGGSGAANAQGQGTARAGGAGSDGIVIVELFG